MADKTSRLKKKLEVRDFKLNSLSEVTMAINENLPTEELLKIYKNILSENLAIEKLLLFTEEDAWTCILKHGVEGVVTDIRNEDFFTQTDSLLATFQQESKTESFDIVIRVTHDEKPIAYLLVGDKDEQIGMSPAIKHMKFIQTITNVIIVAIKNKELVRKHIEQERTRRELELAAEMQAILVPNRLPKNELYEVSAVYQPHQEVGGDYYDFMKLNEEEVMICVADVSGKGVSAAFLMSNFQANLRAIFSYTYPHKNSLTDIIRELNSRVMESAMGEKYITFFIATYNIKTKVMNYINCGHNPPILVNFDDKTSQLLELGSVGLGMFENIPKVDQGTLILKPNSMLVSFTDGLIELENEEHDEFGNERLTKMIFDYEHLPIEEFNQMIMSEAEIHKGSMPYFDDIALLSCKIY